MTLLEADDRKQIQWLAQASRWAVGGLLANAGPVASAGRGDWSDERDYTPGDDYRRIDWNVCARHDELVWRRPAADADRRVYVLLDCSRSMTTGNPSKFDVARRIAAVLGAAALGHLDELTLLAFADRIVAEFPPVRGRSHWLKMIRFLESLAPGGAPTDLAHVAECLVRRRQRPGPAVVIGDFLSPESDRRGLEILRYHGYAPSGVHVCARGDAEPDVLGDVELVDAESGQAWAAVLGRRELARYRLAFEEFCDSVRSFCRRRGIAYLRVRDDTSWRRVVFEVTGKGAEG